MSDRQVYDLENIVESAVKTLLERYELTTFTTADKVDFQKSRPRVEVEFTRGAGQQRWAPRDRLPAALQSERIEAAWKGALHFRVVVTPDAEGRELLADYRSKLRKLIPNLPQLVNGVILRYHAIRYPVDTGDARVIKPEEGYECLILTVQIDLSIQADAWALLE